MYIFGVTVEEPRGSYLYDKSNNFNSILKTKIFF